LEPFIMKNKQTVVTAIVVGVFAVVGAAIGLAARAAGGGSDQQASTVQAPGTPKAKQLWHCGMHPQVIQDHPGDCPICHMKLTPINAGQSAGGEHKVLYWWDPMLGPSSITDHPGKSAMGMDLVPVYADHAAGGPEVVVDPQMVQEMGVQTAPVTRGPLHRTVSVVGMFKLPEPGMHDISLKVGGWIDKLYADQEGMHVHAGEALFALYSPELQVAEQELIGAAKARRVLPAGASRSLVDEADGMVASARRKLQLWDVEAREIDAIEKADQPPKDVTFYSPGTGHLEDKMVVQGSAVQPGMKLMRVADHTKMWLDAQVYADDIPLVRVGQTVKANVEGIAGQTLAGTVSFVYPHLDHMTRTLTARATFDNPDFELKPGMYAEVGIATEAAANAIQVPQEAVIDTGTRQIVFVDEGEGHFGPRTVRAGVRGDDDKVQILDGLSGGENVVTSGQFLMDVESRTNEAIAKMRGGPVAMNEPAPATSATAPTTQPAGLSLVFCPMVKADWLQPPGPVSNPYMGNEMRGCGEVKSGLSMPPKDSPLAPVVDAYLAVERWLTDGRVDSAAVQRLKEAGESLKGDAYAPLRDAAEKLAGAHDLKEAQSRFQAVSAALVPLVTESSKR
jgi:RND family efflux transporter MFP subunit